MSECHDVFRNDFYSLYVKKKHQIQATKISFIHLPRFLFLPKLTNKYSYNFVFHKVQKQGKKYDKVVCFFPLQQKNLLYGHPKAWTLSVLNQQVGLDLHTPHCLSHCIWQMGFLEGGIGVKKLKYITD